MSEKTHPFGVSVLVRKALYYPVLIGKCCPFRFVPEYASGNCV